MSTNNAINLQAQGLAYYNGTGVFSAPSISQYYTIVGAANNSVTGVAPGTIAYPLVSGGASANPSYALLTVPGGGTGAATLTGILTGNGTSAFTASAVSQYYTLTAGASNAVVGVAPGSSGQVLTSNGGSSAPSFQTFTPSAMSPYVNATASAQTMVANTVYVANYSGALLTFTPPSTCAVGTVLAIVGGATSGWTINLTTNSQTINYGSVTATTALASTNEYDAVYLVCTTANSVFSVLNSIGNLSYS